MMQKIISIIIPVFNEEGNILPLYEKLINIFNGSEEAYEIIFVNDGSSDMSFERMKLLHRRDSNVKVISLSRNFGHQMAITAGLNYASGDAAIVMDADLQHPVEAIPELVAKWKEGYDIVFTIRKKTQGISAIKNMCSKLFYKCINLLSDTEIHPDAADFRLMNKKALVHFNNFKEHGRFIRGLVSWLGFTQASIEIESIERFSGKSKYSYKKMVRFATQGIVSFSNIPLIFAFYMGAFVSFLCGVYIIYSFYVKFIIKTALPGWTSVMVTLLFLGGMILMILGIMGIYIGQILEELRSRPLYVVDELLGFSSDEN
jgi:glycosyltransferase involved in cell wall biosynthesis